MARSNVDRGGGRPMTAAKAARVSAVLVRIVELTDPSPERAYVAGYAAALRQVAPSP